MTARYIELVSASGHNTFLDLAAVVYADFEPSESIVGLRGGQIVTFRGRGFVGHVQPLLREFWEIQERRRIDDNECQGK